MSMKQLNLVLVGVLLFFCVIFMKAALTITVPADLYPKVLITLIAFISVMIFIQTMFFNKADRENFPFAGMQYTRVLVTIFSTTLYYFGVKYIGFYLSSFLYIVILCSLLENERNLKKLLFLLLLSLLLVLIIYLGFHVFLQVPTPKGLFF